MRVSCYLVALSVICTAYATAGTATLVGHIYSDQGSSVANALVSVQQTVATPGYQTYRVVTDDHGKFILSVPDGQTYSVCVGSWSSQLLNSCEWALSQSLVKIATGQQNASFQITLSTGAMLQIRLNDPQALLPTVTAVAGGTVPSGAPFVRFGVYSADGRFHVAIPVSADSLGQTHQILVPLNASFNLSIQATGVQVLNQAGVALAAAGGSVASLGFQSSPTNVAQGFYYQVAKLTSN